MRILKKIFKIFMILLVLLFVGITVFFMTFDLNSYRGMIVTKATQALGRPVSIDSISMKMSLIPTVEVKGVKIDNPAEFNQPKPFVQIDSMDVTLALIPLLSGNIELKDFNLSMANIILIDRAGKNNWTFGTALTTVPAVKPTAKPTVTSNDNIFSRLKIDNISVKKLTLSYTKDDKIQNVALLNASIKQLKLFSVAVLYDGKMIKLSGNLGDLASFMAKKPNYTFSLNVEAFNTILKTSGTIGDTVNFRDMTVNISASGKNLKNTVAGVSQNVDKIPSAPFAIEGVIKGNLDGDIKVSPFTVSLDDKAKLTLDATIGGLQSTLKVLANGSLDLSDKDLAAGFGIKPIQVKFDVAATSEHVDIKTLDVAANKSDVSVKGNVSLKSSVPDIVATVMSNYLDADDFMAEKTGNVAIAESSKPTSKGPMFSADKIDLSALKTANASITIAAKTIKVPQVDYIGLNTAIRLQNGNMNVSDLVLKTEAGTLTGNMNVNTSQMPASIAMKLNADDLKLDTFKPVTTYVQGSHLGSHFNLTTSGDSIKAFVNNLNGQILVELTQGTIVNKGFNSLPVIEEMIKNKANPMSFSASDQVSKLECGVVNLSIQNGVMTSKDQIAIETSVVNFAVSGTINLPAEELSLTMVPSVVGLKNNTQRALQLTQIVKISGPFTNLKPSLDAQRTTQAVAQAGLEVLATKLAEKKGIELPIQKQENVGYNLCEKALGRPLKGQTQNRPVPAGVKQAVAGTGVPEKSVKEQIKEQLPPKEEFKKQLFNSLSEALKK